MVKKICVAFSAATMLITCICVLSLVFVPKNNQTEFGMREAQANGALGERKNSIDVLFVGDSEVFSSISPLQMWHERGFTSYDASCAGQRLTYGYTLLQRAFSRQSPRLVVFETNALFREFSLGDAIFRVFENVFPVFEYHDRWKKLNEADLASWPKATWSDDFKGYHANKDIKPADVSNYGTPTDSVEAVPRNNGIVMRMMVEYCRSHGAVPILMSAPSPINWDMSKHNGIESLAKKLGVDYIDLNLVHEDIGIEWNNDTYDAGDHLNNRGATKVSRYMGAYLSKTYALPDHRSDTAYASWNASYQRYRSALEQ